MNHPPAMGGKTAWGVSELLSTKAVEDPEEMRKIKEAQAEFQAREEERLRRLHKLQNRAEDIVAERRQRNLGFEMKAGTNDYEFKLKQDEILRKMLEAKEQKRSQRKEERARLGITKKKKVKSNKKEKEETSSTDSSSCDSSSSSSSSSKSGKKKKEKKSKLKDGAVILFNEIKEAEPEPQKEEAPVDPEQARKDAEARAREREVKRKAKEQAALWAEEVKRKEAEAEAKRQAEAKRKAEELEAKRKAEAEAKKKAEEEAAKQKAAEEEKEKEKLGDGDKRKLFAADGGTRNVKAKVSTGEKTKPVIGGFFEGQTVYAAKNITVKGQVVIKANTMGTIAGPAENNPTQRIAVEFVKREDRLVGRMNVVPAEIKKRR